MQTPAPVRQHQWLHQLVGNWDYAHECKLGPDQPQLYCTGKQTTRSLGGLWILGELDGDGPDGSQLRSIITLGFDPVQNRFVGTYLSSCMTHLWPYTGSLDADERVLTLDSHGPSLSGDGTMGQYQDIFEVVDQDHHRLTSQFLNADGRWVEFMRGSYSRAIG